ncbi:MAG: hypothetical protein GX383_10785, partial [Clostridium sp.]|nr:hypothetical protein [Clostridium sp.]
SLSKLKSLSIDALQDIKKVGVEISDDIGDGLNKIFKNNKGLEAVGIGPVGYFDDIGNIKKVDTSEIPPLNDIQNNYNKIVNGGEGIEGGSDSKLKEVFNTAENYNLSDDTFNNHILDRHGSNSAYNNKSHFNTDFDIKAGIDSTLKGDNFIVKPNTGERSGYIFEQTFKDAIGVNSKGKPLYTLKVVIDEGGNVITAFPKK